MAPDEDVEPAGHAVHVSPPSTSVAKKFSAHEHAIMPTPPGARVPELAGQASHPASPKKKLAPHWQLASCEGWYRSAVASRANTELAGQKAAASQHTDVSSLCPQLCPPQPRNEHVVISSSPPPQRTSSIQMMPRPLLPEFQRAPNVPPPARPKERHTTWALPSEKPSSHTVPHSPACITSMRPHAPSAGPARRCVGWQSSRCRCAISVVDSPAGQRSHTLSAEEMSP
mmetsp:Transcript_41183/g.97620  ORF Transcript_41183/g.97620 Transcript_41183/m.97620 type:complete len:228 (-) Transcript_41183:1260-1943(-)